MKFHDDLQYSWIISTSLDDMYFFDLTKQQTGTSHVTAWPCLGSNKKSQVKALTIDTQTHKFFLWRLLEPRKFWGCSWKGHKKTFIFGENNYIHRRIQKTCVAHQTRFRNRLCRSFFLKGKWECEYAVHDWSNIKVMRWVIICLIFLAEII